MNKKLAALAALSLFLSCPLPCAKAARADTFYVSVSGSDVALATGTEERPWRTIQRGVDALKPGDTLLIGPGTYRERVEIKRGGSSPSSPVTIAALPGARVVVSGADRLAGGWSKAGGGAEGGERPVDLRRAGRARGGVLRPRVSRRSG